MTKWDVPQVCKASSLEAQQISAGQRISNLKDTFIEIII